MQSCFDTIPQRRLVAMLDSLLSMPQYHMGKHVEVGGLDVNGMPQKRYVAHGTGADEITPFDRLVRDQYVGSKTNTVFVNTAVQKMESKDDLMQLLREHIEGNLVKMGKRFYRQKCGIPQGSVLSSILCNYFYAELEREVLGFALGNDCLLLRLLDDFCLITTSRRHGEQFVQVMHRGQAEYGVKVRAAKSLANFEVSTEDGKEIRRCVSEDRFPYCGVQIDMRTLEVSKSKAGTGAAGRRCADCLCTDLTNNADRQARRWADGGSGQGAWTEVPAESGQVGVDFADEWGSAKGAQRVQDADAGNAPRHVGQQRGDGGGQPVPGLLRSGGEVLRVCTEHVQDTTDRVEGGDR